VVAASVLVHGVTGMPLAALLEVEPRSCKDLPRSDEAAELRARFARLRPGTSNIAAKPALSPCMTDWFPALPQ
jgi:hypothetical protein